MKKFLQGLAVAILISLGLYFFIVYIPAVFTGSISPKSELFVIGNISIKWYGFLISVAILSVYFFVLKDFNKYKIDPVKGENALFIVIILGILGARLGFVVQNIDYYSSNLIDILGFRSGGLSIHGAIVGGIIGFWLAQKIFKIRFFGLANIVSPYLFLGAAIGRFGNFFNQEIIGKPTNVAWKMFVESGMRPVGLESNDFFHPVFLYESIILLLFFAIYKIFVEKKYGNARGFAYTLVFYALTRIAVEFFRIDYKPIIAGLDLAQIISLIMVAFGIIIFYGSKNGTRK